MKARYQFRFYPTSQQQQSLAQLFGCVRVVWNDALALCKQSEKKPKSAELQKTVITQAKQTEERAWLSEVSAIPLQQSVADLETAFKNFFDSCKGKRKGRKVGYPRFKKRTNSQSARLTRNGFSIKDNGVYLAKIGIVKPILSRELPSEPSSVIDLSIRSVLCLNCGTQQDRDLNAARNINKVGIGHCHDSKRTQRGRKTTKGSRPL
jgi:putative transposase